VERDEARATDVTLCVIIYAILLRYAYDAIRSSARSCRNSFNSAKLGRKLEEIREFVFCLSRQLWELEFVPTISPRLTHCH